MGIQGSKIVCVDDDALMVQLLTVALESQGAEVVRHSDPREATVESLRAERPDLITVDLVMPFVDGFQLLRSWREDPALRDTPVLVMTARADRIGEGELPPPSAKLAKPFELQELIGTVERLLGGAKPGRPLAAS